MFVVGWEVLRIYFSVWELGDKKGIWDGMWVKWEWGGFYFILFWGREAVQDFRIVIL